MKDTEKELSEVIARLCAEKGLTYTAQRLCSHEERIWKLNDEADKARRAAQTERRA